MTHRFQSTLLLVAVSICMAATCGTGSGSESVQDVSSIDGRSDLVQHLSDLVTKDPSLPLADLIRLANDALAGSGLRYPVVMVNEPPEQRCEVAAVHPAGLVLTEAEFPGGPLCEDNLVCRLYVRRFVDDTIELAEPPDSRRIDIPKELSFPVALIVRPRTGVIVSKFYLPGMNSERLYRVSTDGESVFWRLELPESASEWWSRVRAREPRLQDEATPFLALRILRSAMRFERKVELMTAPLDAKPPLEFPGRFRAWPYGAFESNGYLVLVFNPCG